MRKAKAVVVSHNNFKEIYCVTVATYQNTNITLIDYSNEALCGTPVKPYKYACFADLAIDLLKLLKSNGFYCEKTPCFGGYFLNDIIWVDASKVYCPHRNVLFSQYIINSVRKGG